MNVHVIVLNLYIERKWKSYSYFWFFTDGKQHKTCEPDMITLSNHAPQSYMTGLLYNLQLDEVTVANFANSLYTFGQSEKRQ